MSTKRIFWGLVVIIAAGYFGYQEFVAQQNNTRFETGVAAYEAGNCSDAQASFGEMSEENETQAPRISAITSECDIFQQGEAAEAEGAYGTAIAHYMNLQSEHSGSALNAFGTERMEILITEQGIAVANGDLCEVDMFNTLTQSDSSNLSNEIQLACGEWNLDFTLENDSVPEGRAALIIFETIRSSAEEGSDLRQTAEDMLFDTVIQLASAQIIGSSTVEDNVTLSIDDKYQIVQAILANENASKSSLPVVFMQDVVNSTPAPDYIEEAFIVYADAAYRYGEQVLEAGTYGLGQGEVLTQGLLYIINEFPDNEAYADVDMLLAGFFEGDAQRWADDEPSEFAAGNQRVIDHITAMITVLDEVSEDNPDVYAEAESLYADAMMNFLNALAEQQDIPEIGQPNATIIDSENAVISIQNASPNGIQMILSGTRNYIEVLPACPTCRTYTGSGPETCPDEGPSTQLEVEPGTYIVVVSTQSDSSITPFRGTWTLEAGRGYPNCFFVVER